MFQNLLELYTASGVQLYLLGVTTDSLPRLTCLGYVAQKDAPDGTEYLAKDLDDPHILHRIITLTPLKAGWHMWRAEDPCFPLETPAPFMHLGEIRDDQTQTS